MGFGLRNTQIVHHSGIAGIRKLNAFLVVVFAGLSSISVWAQNDIRDVSALRTNDQPGLLIVIFSPEVDTSNRTATQGAVWKAFIERLKK